MEKNVKSISIFALTVLLIPADGQMQVDVFRHRNFAIWSIGTKVLPVLVKNSGKIGRFCHIWTQKGEGCQIKAYQISRRLPLYHIIYLTNV